MSEILIDLYTILLLWDRDRHLPPDQRKDALAAADKNAKGQDR